MDLLPDDFAPKAIYLSPEVTAFVAKVLEKDVLYRSEDPLDGCNLTVYEEGDELGWHFDQSEFSVTLMIQRSDTGGDFEAKNCCWIRRSWSWSTVSVASSPT
jgi:hypothetical protein